MSESLRRVGSGWRMLVLGTVCLAATGLAFATGESAPAIARSPFFRLKTATERSGILEIWVQAIRVEAGKAKPGQDLNHAPAADIWRYSCPTFRSLFGAAPSELTHEQRYAIGEALTMGAFREKWILDFGSIFTRDNDQTRMYALAFEAAEGAAQPARSGRSFPGSLVAGGRRNDAALQQRAQVDDFMVKQMADAKLQQERSKSIVPADDYYFPPKTERITRQLVHETAAYRCYVAEEGEFADVILVHKVDEKTPILDNAEYWARFEQEIAPRVRQKTTRTEWTIINEMAGWYLYSDRRSFYLSPTPGRSVMYMPFSSALYSVNNPAAKRKWVYGNRLLADEGVPRDESVASVEGMRHAIAVSGDVLREANQKALSERRTRHYQGILASEPDSLATEILQRWRGKSATEYGFEGCVNQAYLKAVFQGDFQEVIPIVALDMSGLGSAEASAPQMRLRLQASRAYVGFHSAYEKRYGVDRGQEWMELVYQSDQVTKDGFGNVISRRPDAHPIVYHIRKPFAATFAQCYDYTNSGGMVDLLLNMNRHSSGEKMMREVEGFTKDFDRILADHAADSNFVRQLETNLFLLVWDQPPLQALKTR